MKRSYLIQFRNDRKLTKGELGEMLDVTGQYVGMVERCKANGGKKFWRHLQNEFNLSDVDIENLKHIEK